MTLKMVLAVIALSAWTLPVHAADKAVNPNPGVDMSKGPISAGTLVSPGRYVATIAPTLNTEMAGRLKNTLNSFPGIKDADASSTDSTVRFTVKEGAKLRLADLQGLVAKTDAGAVMTAPVLEHSMTPKPGL